MPEPRDPLRPSRRAVTLGVGGLALAGGAVSGLTAWRQQSGPDRIGPRSPEVLAAERRRPTTGRVVTRDLTARPTTIDLAGTEARTWAFDGAVPASPIRLTAGDQLRASLHNGVTSPTTVHWHGLALRNDMDGVPGLTMPGVAPGSSFDYHFTVPDPGTYWFHPHVGVQIDTGLLGALVVEDPHEPLAYDDEAVLMLDDWTDGVGPSPDAVLARLRSKGMGAMTSMQAGGGVDAAHPLGTDTGDVSYPLHLINGRPPKDPWVLTTRPGRRLRLRLINAGADTAYRFAIGGHQLTVVASDGYPVEPVEVDSLIIGMGERYDVLVTAEDGVFSIVSRPVGKQDPAAYAVLRSAPGRAPAPGSVGTGGRLLTYADLRPTEAVALSRRTPDRTLDVVVQMKNGGRQWLINGRTYADHLPLDVRDGERVRLRMRNDTMMFHPMHLHGHTYALVRGGRPGVRKDTLDLLPSQRLDVDFEADNPGQWLLHCHNGYHGELGMMTVLSYVV